MTDARAHVRITFLSRVRFILSILLFKESLMNGPFLDERDTLEDSFLSRPEIAVMGCGFQAEVAMAPAGLVHPGQLPGRPNGDRFAATVVSNSQYGRYSHVTSYVLSFRGGG